MNRNIPSSSNNGNNEQAATAAGGSDPTVDTALLETVFYNEMMMMDNKSSSLSSNFLAYLSSDPTSNTLHANKSNHAGGGDGTAAPIDASAMAERDLLRDFGVSSPIPSSIQNIATLPQQQQQQQPQAAGGAAASATNFQPIPTKQISLASTSVATSTPTVAVPVSGSTTTVATSVENNTVARNISSNNNSVVVSSTAQAQETEFPPQQAGTEQLVSQFAELASRLGVSLPPNVLSSLTAKAAIINNEAKQQRSSVEHPPQMNDGRSAPIVQPSQPSTTASGATQPSTGSVTQPPPSSTSGRTSLPSASAITSTTPTPTSSGITAVPPVVQQLAQAAEAAINAASETRKRAQQQQADDKSSTADGNKPQTYSKRRKKPKLTDCEAKLASLKDENERLKRHLDNVTNQSHKFEIERKNTENLLRTLINTNDKTKVDSDKLHTILSKYTEMYADYGRHRNQELSFHLQQLERLAAPTNFTKMGLWTLGQNEGFYTNPKQNPIAGILRKELGITPQQGRKIIEQRQKICDLSTNLKKGFALLANLKELCEHKQKLFQDRISKCQEILTPVQVAKLIFWVDEHEATLNAVSPGWGSECIRANKSSPNAAAEKRAEIDNENKSPP